MPHPRPNESVDPSEIENMALTEALFLRNYAADVSAAELRARRRSQVRSSDRAAGQAPIRALVGGAVDGSAGAYLAPMSSRASTNLS